MKLYATTSTNRATKGQGGDYLLITLYGEKKDILYIITLKNDYLRLADKDGKIIFAENTKGKRQKGECNAICPNYAHKHKNGTISEAIS